MTNKELIKSAEKHLNPVSREQDYSSGDVACALLSESGNLYHGVCIDVMSGMGFCAEHSAIAAMVTAGEFKISKIVAVWCGEDGLHVLSPCGRCREFINQIDPFNLKNTQVILDIDKSVVLEELLPYAKWFQNIDLSK